MSSVYISLEFMVGSVRYPHLENYKLVHILKRGTPEPSIYSKRSQEVDKFRSRRVMSRTFGFEL